MFFQYFLQLVQVNVAFERMLDSCVECLINGAIYGSCFSELNMPLGGVEMRVAGNQITGV